LGCRCPCNRANTSCASGGDSNLLLYGNFDIGLDRFIAQFSALTPRERERGEERGLRERERGREGKRER